MESGNKCNTSFNFAPDKKTLNASATIVKKIYYDPHPDEISNCYPPLPNEMAANLYSMKHHSHHLRKQLLKEEDLKKSDTTRIDNSQ